MSKINSFLYFIRLPILAIIIIAVGLYLILLTNGYKYYSQAKKLQQMGMIYIQSNPKDVKVYLNNELKSNKTPARLNDLYSGRYDIRIEREGYQTWQKTLTVEPGLVSVENNVVLFLTHPEEINVSKDEIEVFKKLPNKLLNTDLEIRNSSEIWIKSVKENEDDVLVTRLSQPIKKVVYYSDKKHILFQVKNEIRVIDLDGSNNLQLMELPSEEMGEFFVDDSGQFLFYQSGEKIKKMRII